MTLEGEFNDQLRPQVKVNVSRTHRTGKDIDFLVDSGFNGDYGVAVSNQTAGALGLERLTVATVNTPGGDHEFDVCLVYLRWSSSSSPNPQLALMCEIDAIGTQALLGSLVTLDINSGGKVIIEFP